jgi:hypothetical protein
MWLHNVLPVARLGVRKLVGRTTELLRRHTNITQHELALYHAIETRLMQSTEPARASRFESLLLLPPAPVVRQALATEADYRMIDPRQQNVADTEFLHQHGLDRSLLLENTDVIGYEPGQQSRKAKRTRGATEFQREALAARALEAICPLTGQRLRSDRSFIAEQNQPIFYFFRAQQPFFIAVGREGRGYVKLYLYFPTWRTAILLTDPMRWHGRDEIDQLRAHLIAEQQHVGRYLARTDPAPVCALVDNRQFAHCIWNVLSGIEWLIDEGHLAHIDKLVIAAEPIGRLERIFPELENVPIERTHFPTLIDAGLDGNWFLLRPGGICISDKLIERVHRFAELNTPPRLRMQLARIMKDRWPIVCVTLRMGNRTWVSQVQGIIAIGLALAKDTPRAAMIIDGFSRLHGPSSLPSREQEQLIAEELAAVKEIRTAIGHLLPIHTTIGQPIAHSFAYMRIIDCYLAHHGSLQHKVGWLSGAPGVVHSNSMVLSTPDLWEPALKVRAGAPRPIYVNASKVQDVPGARRVSKNRWLDDLDNYEMDPMDAYRPLQQIIEQLRGSAAADHGVG